MKQLGDITAAVAGFAAFAVAWLVIIALVNGEFVTAAMLLALNFVLGAIAGSWFMRTTRQ